jgi:hypothetical protein
MIPDSGVEYSEFASLAPSLTLGSLHDVPCVRRLGGSRLGGWNGSVVCFGEAVQDRTDTVALERRLGEP